MMEKKIYLPNFEAVKHFVRESEASHDTVIVTKEGFKYQIDGASLLGMMNVIGAKLIVNYYGHSNQFLRVLEQYAAS